MDLIGPAEQLSALGDSAPHGEEVSGINCSLITSSLNSVLETAFDLFNLPHLLAG